VKRQAANFFASVSLRRRLEGLLMQSKNGIEVKVLKTF
jgi:hypothetical protein